MAKRTTATTPIQPLSLQMSRREAKKKLTAQIKSGHDLLKFSIQNETEFRTVEGSYFTWTEYVGQLLVFMFSNDDMKREFAEFGGALVSRNGGLAWKIEELHNDIGESVRRLRSIHWRIDVIPLGATIKGTP